MGIHEQNKTKRKSVCSVDAESEQQPMYQQYRHHQRETRALSMNCMNGWFNEWHDNKLPIFHDLISRTHIIQQ